MTYCYVDDDFLDGPEIQDLANRLEISRHQARLMVATLIDVALLFDCDGTLNHDQLNAIMLEMYPSDELTAEWGDQLMRDYYGLVNSGILRRDGNIWRFPDWIRFDTDALEAEQPDVKDAPPLFPWALHPDR